jgi:hypothetical protein
MTDQDPASTTKVGILARVIATGIEQRDGDRQVCLATLSLMPWIAQKEGRDFARSVALENWPADVESMLARARLFVSPVDPHTSGKLQPNCGALGTGIPLRRSAVALFPEYLQRATKLWRDLIAESDDSVWPALVQMLRSGQAGSTLKNVCAPTQAGGDGGHAAGSESGGMTAQPSFGPPDVLAYPRADAALLYGFQRAREVLRAMLGTKGQCRVGSCVIKTGGRFLDLADFTFDRKPWLGLDGPLVRLAQATQSDAPSSTLSGFARSDQLLAQERTAQEAAYRRRLAGKTAQAKQQNQLRGTYLKGETVNDRMKTLKEHAAARPTSLRPTDCADACGDTTGDSVANQLTDDVKSAHGLGSLPDVDQLGNPVVAPNDLDDAFEVAMKQAQQRLFAITSMPSLARLLNLVVDVEFDLDDLLDALGFDAETAKNTGFVEKGAIDHYGAPAGKVRISKDAQKSSDGLRAHYMFLISNLGRAEDIIDAADPTGTRDPPRVWTLTKFRMPIAGNPLGKAGHFWPCTREEVDVRLSKRIDGDATGTAIRDACAVFQYDGVVDLGVTYCGDDGTRNPRYDIISLDTIQTVESDMQSDRRLKQQANTAPGDRLPSTDLGVQTRRTGGLAVVDRWRQDQVVSQITTAQYHTNQQNDADIVLDAEDMTSAYRLDVAVDVGKAPGGKPDETALVWRCLMNRKMQFGGASDGRDWLEPVIQALYHWRPPAGHSVERRRRADSASLSIASRLRDNGVQRDDRASRTAFGEQIMIAWHGDPLGVDCLDPHGSSAVKVEDFGLSMPATALPLEIRYELENRDIAEAYRPPPLRYGWPYHLGLRPVYLGGVILPLELAIPRYELNFGTGSSLPSPAQQVGRRFLRHERIEAPLLTVPASIADAVNKLSLDVLKEDPARGVTGATCLLRTSLVKDEIVNDGPTVRILFPPVMPLEQAALHGVFDKTRVESVSLEQKDENGKPLKDENGNALPPYELKRPIDGLNKQKLDFSGDRDGVSEGGFPHAVRLDRDKSKEARGPAIFHLSDRLKPRPIPFYPDPAATSYVITVRRPQSDDYLDNDDPIVVPAYSQPHEPEVRYPNVLPLAIEIRKRSERTPPAHRVKDIFPGNATLAYADSNGMLSGSHVGLAVRHLVAELAPGEDFEIEVWCIPSAHALRGQFDIVESVAVLLMRESATEHLAEGRLDQACVAGLKRYFKGGSWEKLAEQEAAQNKIEAAIWHRDRSDLAKFNPLCGPGGISLPQAEVMKLVAECLVDALRRGPIPELAATTRIHAIHAVNKPLAPPSFVDAQHTLRVVRLNDTSGKALLYGLPAGNPKVNLLNARDAHWQNLSDDGATNAIFDGTVDVDLLTTHDVELRATMVSPASAVFDDVNRGRSAEEKARGEYRPANSVPGVTRWKPLPQAFDEEHSRSLYGFIVCPDGRVRLSKHSAPLMALHRLPEVPIPQRGSKNERTFHLLEQQQLAARADPTTSADTADPAIQPCRVQYLQPFRDGLARKLELTLVAASRFSNLFKTPSTNKIGQDRQASSEPYCLWLPATKRPDALSAKSLRPAFVWNFEPAKFSPSIVDLAEARSVTTAVRTCSIRLPFERPHFTSGEGERVGIVIWPPDLMLAATEQEVAHDCVRRSEQEGQTIRLDNKFSDSDLGPGGEYVTRWGADPTREGPRPDGWLIPKKAFLGYSAPGCADADVAKGCAACSDPKACAACGDPKAYTNCCYETGRPVFVPNVLMPIPRKPDASQGRGDNGSGSPSSDNDAQSKNDRSGDAAGREFMLVSLLTYEPRFDIDYERWYIDIHIDAGSLPEPFIRMGLVRFQPHARPEMQVSEPIAQWVQLMPKRTICVAAEPPGPSNRVKVAIEVKTPAAYDGSAPQFDPGSGRPSAASSAPYMRALILRQETTGGGVTIQTIVSPEGTINSQGTQLLPQRIDDDGTVWSGTVDFPCRPAVDTGSEYSVFVEEVQAFDSTANPYEAGTGAQIADVVESGPRFAAIVPISFPRDAPMTQARPAAPPRHHQPKPVKTTHRKPRPPQENQP